MHARVKELLKSIKIFYGPVEYAIQQREIKTANHFSNIIANRFSARNRQLQTLVNGLTTENLELKSRVARLELETTEKTSRLKKIEAEVLKLKEAELHVALDLIQGQGSASVNTSSESSPKLAWKLHIIFYEKCSHGCKHKPHRLSHYIFTNQRALKEM